MSHRSFHIRKLKIQIAIWYHTSKNADKLAATISRDFGVKTKTYQVDVQDYSAVEKAVADVVNDFGRLDVMIANAGIPTKAGGLDDRVEDWNHVRAVDFDGAYYCARASGLVFKKQGRKYFPTALTILLCAIR